MLKKLVVVVCVIFSYSAMADDAAAVKRVEDYLNNLKTFQADFVQIDARGGVSDGKFYLSRPKRFRWEYKPPVPIVITASRGVVNYYDTELKESTSVLLSSTPGGVLADEHIAFEQDRIKEVKQTSDTTSVTLWDEDKENTITLVFKDTPMVLERLIIQDALAQKTTILFNNQETGMEIKKKLFMPLNPYEYNQRRRN